MRTIVVTDSMIWNAETEYALAVAATEAAMGFDVTVAAPQGSVALERAAEGVRAEALPGANLSSSPADLLAVCRRLATLARGDGGIIIHSSRSSAHVAAALARGPTAKLVHLRGGATPPKAGGLNRMLYRCRTDAVIASSERIASWVRSRLAMPDERVFRLHLPVDGARFSSQVFASSGRGLRRDLAIDAGARLVVNVARLAPVKGHDVLLEAWAGVAGKHPDAVLVLVGEAWSGQPEGLALQAEELGISARVRFAGRREDVPSVLDEADVCVCSSVGSEENSRAVSEYMAAGRPVVATRVGVIPELVVDAETGHLVAPSNATALAEALDWMLAHPDRATAMGRLGRERAAGLFSRDAFAASLSRVLTSIGIACGGVSS